MFQPLVQDNKCYFDGGLFANYPVEQCLKLVDEVKIDEILGVNSYIIWINPVIYKNHQILVNIYFLL